MKTFKKIKNFAARAGAAILLIVIGALGSCAVAFGVIKLMLLVGVSTTAALVLVGGGAIVAGLSSGWFFARHPDLTTKIYNWVHNFTHWNDEVYIVA